VLVGDLGGTVLSGGLAVGYRPMQVHLGNADSGMKVELLEPWRADENDFLDRFVTRHGDGPHHLTFKVDDLQQALEYVAAAGLVPVGVDLSYPIWKEAFLQPRDSHGTVVQLAESSSTEKSALDEYALVAARGVRLMEGEGSEQWWPDPPPRAPDVTFLRRIVMATPDLSATRDFFTGLLGGTEASSRKDRMDLTWPGGGCIRLEARADRPAGIDRLELEGPGPARELVTAGTRFVVEPPSP